MSTFKQAFYSLVTTTWNSKFPMPNADRGDCINIICLHGVHTPQMATLSPPPTSSITADSFESNIRAISKRYQIISLSDAVDMLAGRRAWRGHCAVLTFDDSLKCTSDVAFPILRRLGFTATVFISTAAIETGAPYWWLRLEYDFHHAKRPRAEINLSTSGRYVVEAGDADSLRRLKSVFRRTPANARESAISSMEEQWGVRLTDAPTQYPYATNMSWDDVRGVIEQGFSVGSHTVEHANLAILPLSEAEHELKHSKKVIEQQTGIPCRHFCYPYGGWTEQVAACVRQCGYDAATTTVGPGRNRLGQEPTLLRRYAAPGAPSKLAYILTGFPEVLGRAKNALRRKGATPASVNSHSAS